jgi:hypothetical protein
LDDGHGVRDAKDDSAQQAQVIALLFETYDEHVLSKHTTYCHNDGCVSYAYLFDGVGHNERYYHA